jgi:hypothetical protein
MSAPIEFPGICPMLTCDKTEPHEHSVCPDCNTYRYGNVFYCETCNLVSSAERAIEGLSPIPMAGDASRRSSKGGLGL